MAVLHLAAAVAYFYYRIRYTLVGAALEHPDYARYVLIVELFSAVSMLLYSSNLLFVTNIEVTSSITWGLMIYMWTCPPAVRQLSRMPQVSTQS